MKTVCSLATLVMVLAIVGESPVQVAQTVSETERNREVVRRHLELMNRGDWKQAAELFAPDVRHHLGSWREGREGIVPGQKILTDNLEDIFRTFPDWKMEIVEMVAESESVVVRCRVSGTHRGVGTKRINGGFLVGVPPTGKRFEVQHIHGTSSMMGRSRIISRTAMT